MPLIISREYDYILQRYEDCNLLYLNPIPISISNINKNQGEFLDTFYIRLRNGNIGKNHKNRLDKIINMNYTMLAKSVSILCTFISKKSLFIQVNIIIN